MEPNETIVETAQTPETSEEAAPEVKMVWRRYYESADALKFWLMPFVCIACFGFPTRFGGEIAALSGFAPLCFFILCGFFTLTGEEDEQRRLKKGIRRCAYMFGLMFAVCFVLNVIACLINGVEFLPLFRALFSKRLVFNFLVLCAWPFPMGESLWFIQSLLYAYIGLYLLNHLKLPFIRPVLLILCTVLMLVSGEFAGVAGFRFFGAPYLPPNVFTRALPYLLLGSMLRKHKETLRQRKAWVYLLMAPVGLALAAGEFTLLSHAGLLINTSHAIGLGLTAFGLCTWMLLYVELRPNFFSYMGRPVARRVYLLSQPIALLLLLLVSALSQALTLFVQTLGGLIVYPLCLGLALLGGRAHKGQIL